MNSWLLPWRGNATPPPPPGPTQNLNTFQPFDPSPVRGIGDRFALLRGPNADQVWVSFVPAPDPHPGATPSLQGTSSVRNANSDLEPPRDPATKRHGLRNSQRSENHSHCRFGTPLEVGSSGIASAGFSQLNTHGVRTDVEKRGELARASFRPIRPGGRQILRDRVPIDASTRTSP